MYGQGYMLVQRSLAQAQICHSQRRPHTCTLKRECISVDTERLGEPRVTIRPANHVPTAVSSCKRCDPRTLIPLALHD